MEFYVVCVVSIAWTLRFECVIFVSLLVVRLLFHAAGEVDGSVCVTSLPMLMLVNLYLV